MSGYKTNTFLLLTEEIVGALFAAIVSIKRRRKMKIKLVGLFLVLAMIGIIAGSNLNEANASQDDKTIKVVWLSFGLSHEWFHSLSIFAEHEARKIEKEDGVKFEFIIKDGQRNLQTQLQQFDQLIAQKNVDIIYFEPIDQTALAKMVKKVNKKLNIPIGSAGIMTNGGHYLYVGLDNVAATERCGEQLIRLLNEKYGKGQWPENSVVMENWGPPGISITTNRHAGFWKTFEPALKENPTVKMVNATGMWDPATAFKAASDVLTKYGDKLIGAYSHDDPSATEGIVRALELKKLQYPVGHPKHIPIVSYDATKTGMQAIRDKEIDVITEQPARGYAHLVMRYLYEWHKNGYESLPKPGTVLTKTQLKQMFSQETGVDSWSPATVKKGINWDGIWIAPKSPLIPNEVDPYAKSQWGNYMYWLDKNEWPKK